MRQVTVLNPFLKLPSKGAPYRIERPVGTVFRLVPPGYETADLPAIVAPMQAKLCAAEPPPPSTTHPPPPVVGR